MLKVTMMVDKNVFEVDVDTFKSGRVVFGFGKCDGIGRLLAAARV
jgi:hypothetical protein